MSNQQDNGTVLPFGLLSAGSGEMLEGFKKTYQNSSLRVGIIRESYGIKDAKNIGKLVPEYDVMVFEQNEDKGATVITYKNCMAASALGSIADFFEANLRKLKKKKTKGETPSMGGQNGAVVLLLCLDSVSEKGIIVGALSHPDRKSTLVDTDPHLEGEYNGVNVKVEKSGAVTLTFKGATDNDGKITDTKQGPTTMKIETDGSFQINHDAVTLRLAKDGNVSVKAKKDITLTTETNLTVKATKNLQIDCVDATVNASGKVNVKAGGDATIEAAGTAIVEGKDIKLGKGAAEAVVKGDAFKKLYDAHVHPTAVGPSGPPAAPLAPSALSKKVKTE